MDRPDTVDYLLSFGEQLPHEVETPEVGPMEGIKVVEIGLWIAGPSCGGTGRLGGPT